MRRELEAAELEADRLARLVTDLAGAWRQPMRPPPSRSRSTCAAPARQAVERFSPRAEAAARTIELVDGPAAYASASVGDVATALDNLIENALVHTPPETRVQLEVGTNDMSAWVAVLDDGPGLAPEDLALAFERFRRGAGGGPTRRGRGWASRSPARWRSAGAGAR